jgi:hypothetical protein
MCSLHAPRARSLSGMAEFPIKLAPMRARTAMASSHGKLMAARGERRVSILGQGASASRARIAALVRYHLARHGLLLLNARSRLGLDYMRDIEWLAERWGIPSTHFLMSEQGDAALAAFQRFPGAHVYSFEPHPSTFAKLGQSETSTCSNTICRCSTVSRRTRHSR